jgi:putative exosortase-associated protein (TIGR04073 family)
MNFRRWLPMAVACLCLSFMASEAMATGPLYEHSRAAKMTRKLGRGVMNVLFCWGEIPHFISQDVQNLDPFTGIITGTGKGIVAGARRFAIGVFDVFTFPVEIPDNYADMQRTEFVFMEDLD